MVTTVKLCIINLYEMAKDWKNGTLSIAHKFENVYF